MRVTGFRVQGIRTQSFQRVTVGLHSSRVHVFMCLPFSSGFRGSYPVRVLGLRALLFSCLGLGLQVFGV